MARQPKQEQARKPAKQEQAAAAAGGKSWLHQSVNWPVHEVLLSKGWNTESAIITAIIARRSPRSGKIAAGSFLVDLGCLGVKSAFIRICKSPEDYEQRMRTPLMEDQKMIPAEFNLVAKIITEGHNYAQGLGLSPDPEFQQARLLLSGAQPEACKVEIRLGGPEGKPIFVARQNDDIPRILGLLARTLGPDGFYYMLPGDTEKQVFDSRLPGVGESQ
jgi:hypothetical protein